MFYFCNDEITKEIKSIVEVRDNGEHWFIPLDENNSDYQRYLEWAGAGNEATEYVCPFPPATPLGDD
jgi:hypothetical protein